MKKTIPILALCLAAACADNVSPISYAGQEGVARSLGVLDVSQGASFEQMLNEVRAATGASPVRYNAELAKAAQRHADDMYANRFMSHTGSDGSSLKDRIDDTAFKFSSIAENIAWGSPYQDEKSVLIGWINSPGHQKNNIHPAFKYYALAKAGSGKMTYWALVLGND